jgi:uncharacterized protein (TIGR03643 family)
MIELLENSEQSTSLSKALSKNILLSDVEIDRIIEMAWEDRTPFDAIEFQFGLKEAGVKELMKKNLKLSSYKLWRKRVHNCNTKHVFLDLNAHCKEQ